MAKTGAERQAEYRARRMVQDSGHRRISTWISTEAAMALETLSGRYGVTMRDVIEMLLLREQRSIDSSLAEHDIFSKDHYRKKALPRNDSPKPVRPVADKVHKDSLLRNKVETLPTPAPTTPAAPEPPKGGQYSLEL